jgi:adenine/guanine phosphoribosyltransferase-like PRPP-binding protein
MQDQVILELTAQERGVALAHAAAAALGVSFR